MQPSVTISLVPQAKGGPFVFWGDLAGGCAKAAALGYAAVEIFLPGADALDQVALRDLLDQHRLKLAALGTGAGWVIHRWTLTHPEAAIRGQAKKFIGSLIDLAASFGAPAIVGSMQGRFENEVTREQALAWLGEGLNELGARAQDRGVPLFFEPINRYETNLCNRLGDAVELLASFQSRNVKLLADLFHMNIEEVSIADALRAAGKHVGHVHFVDSNRRPAGAGHLDFRPVIAALREIGYAGYLSAESLPHPNPESAARQTMATFRRIISASQ